MGAFGGKVVTPNGLRRPTLEHLAGFVRFSQSHKLGKVVANLLGRQTKSLTGEAQCLHVSHMHSIPGYQEISAINHLVNTRHETQDTRHETQAHQQVNTSQDSRMPQYINASTLTNFPVSRQKEGASQQQAGNVSD